MSAVQHFGVVEDGEEDFYALRRVLGLEHTIRRWNNGTDALAALQGGGLSELSMLFVDCHLPGMDGLDLVRELRKAPDGQAARITMISGSTTPDIEQRALAAGVDHFERKGTSIADLRAAVTRAFAALDPSALPKPQTGGAKPSAQQLETDRVSPGSFAPN